MQLLSIFRAIVVQFGWLLPAKSMIPQLPKAANSAVVAARKMHFPISESETPPFGAAAAAAVKLEIKRLSFLTHAMGRLDSKVSTILFIKQFRKALLRNVAYSAAADILVYSVPW